MDAQTTSKVSTSAGSYPFEILRTYRDLPSMMTTAIATERLWVRLSSVLTTPNCCALSAALPLQCKVGFSPCLRLTSISFQEIPRLIPVPSAFAPASFAANLAVKLSAEPFFRRQYAISSGVKTRSRKRSPNRLMLSSIRTISIKSVPSPTTIHTPPSSYCNPTAGLAEGDPLVT